MVMLPTGLSQANFDEMREGRFETMYELINGGLLKLVSFLKTIELLMINFVGFLPKLF